MVVDRGLSMMALEGTPNAELILGGLMEAVAGLKTQIKDLATLLDTNQKNQTNACKEHWGITNGLVTDMRTERGARETVIAAAKTAKETIATDATAAAALAIHDAADAAEAKSALEIRVTSAIATSATDARKAIADAAAEARLAVKAEAGENRQQHHWLIERIMPMVYPGLSAAGVYLFMKAQGG